MKCPHCHLGISIEWDEIETWKTKDFNVTGNGQEVAYGQCPECEEFIFVLRTGKYTSRKLEGGTIYSSVEDFSEEFLYPKYAFKDVEPEVPEKYKKEYLEAHSVLNMSPKASAALSRRLLQNILREELEINASSLAGEIDTFINLSGTPSYLAEAVDAIRNVGNFAAHPSKDINTGEVVDVEPGEAEWLIEVIESVFDFVFVQPKRLEERKARLNKKLKSIGKPKMKSKNNSDRDDMS